MKSDLEGDQLEEVRRINIAQILRTLPHRFPFVMVDRVTSLTINKSISGHKCVAYNEPWFQGHFPIKPIMPGVLIIEALAQIGGILAHASTQFDPASRHSLESGNARLMYFLGIDKARFRKVVEPGDRLDLHVEVVRRRSNVWKLRGCAKVDTAIAAEAELLASSVEAPI